MRQLSGRWVAIGVAVVVVVGLAFYSLSARPSAMPATTSQPEGSVTGLTQPAPATEQPATTTAPVMTPGAIFGLLVKIGIVGVLLGGSLWALKRFAGTSTRGGGRTGAVKIVDTLPLAQGRALYLVDLGDRAVLVGATPQQFSALAELTDRDALARLRATEERPDVALAGMVQRFAGLAQSLMTPRTAGRGTADDETVERTDMPAAGRPATFAEAFVQAGGEPAPRQLAAQPPVAEPPAHTYPESNSAADGTADRLRSVAERLRATRQAQA
jgi:flagellar biogenesis protein FliO